MTRAARIPLGAWPRMLNRDQSSAYVGTSQPTFLAEVKAGIWPSPTILRDREFWDRALLDEALNVRSGLDAEPGEKEALEAIDEHRKAQVRY